MSKSINKKKTNVTIKRELLNSLQENDNVEEQELNEKTNNVNNSEEAMVIIRRYEDIIKTKNKKAIGYIGQQGEILKTFLIMSVKADQSYILKFHFISFRRNILSLKNPPYNQVVLKIILKLSRLFAKKT